VFFSDLELSHACHDAYPGVHAEEHRRHKLGRQLQASENTQRPDWISDAPDLHQKCGRSGLKRLMTSSGISTSLPALIFVFSF
jgi:hypothetical protein